MKRVLLALCAVALLAGVSYAAKPAKMRKSVGFNTQTGVDAVSYRVWTGKNGIGWEALLGFADIDNGTGAVSTSVLGGKYLKCLKKEQNLKAYFFALVAIKDTGENGTMLGGGLGVEFFLNGLPNLGFGAEIAAISDDTKNAKFTGISAGPESSIGVRYYFK
ncbi:hypothetical protein ACFL58_04335 [Elusimicrobiota bacterium]